MSDVLERYTRARRAVPTIDCEILAPIAEEMAAEIRTLREINRELHDGICQGKEADMARARAEGREERETEIIAALRERGHTGAAEYLVFDWENRRRAEGG